MSKKIIGFGDLKVEKDTRLISRVGTEADGLECVHEKWSFDGLLGESLIFRATETLNRSDKDLEALVKESGLEGIKISV